MTFPTRLTDTQIAHAMVAGATLGLAFKGIFARLAYLEGLSVTSVIAMRTLLAAPLFWVLVVLMRRKSDAPKSAGTPRDHIGAAMIGVLFISATLFDFMAIERIGAALSRVILFAYPGFILVLDAIRTRTWPSRRHVSVFALAWAGLLLVAAPNGFGALDAAAWAGIGFSLLAALSYAIFSVASQGGIKVLGSSRFAALTNTGAAVVVAIGLLLFVDASDLQINASGAGWVVGMIIFSTVIPVFMMLDGIGRLGSSRVGLLMLTGPPITVFAAWLVLDETLQPLQLVGTALVLAAMGLLKLNGPFSKKSGHRTRDHLRSGGRIWRRLRRVRRSAP